MIMKVRKTSLKEEGDVLNQIEKHFLKDDNLNNLLEIKLLFGNFLTLILPMRCSQPYI